MSKKYDIEQKITNEEKLVIFLLTGGSMYRKIYQCKLCKKIVEKEIEGETYESINIKMLNNYSFNKNEVHLCGNEDIGILEFLGCRRTVL